jgi:hypothetical protein
MSARERDWRSNSWRRLWSDGRYTDKEQYLYPTIFSGRVSWGKFCVDKSHMVHNPLMPRWHVPALTIEWIGVWPRMSARERDWRSNSWRQHCFIWICLPTHCVSLSNSITDCPLGTSMNISNNSGKNSRRLSLLGCQKCRDLLHKGDG